MTAYICPGCQLVGVCVLGGGGGGGDPVTNDLNFSATHLRKISECGEQLGGNWQKVLSELLGRKIQHAA